MERASCCSSDDRTPGAQCGAAGGRFRIVDGHWVAEDQLPAASFEEQIAKNPASSKLPAATAQTIPAKTGGHVVDVLMLYDSSFNAAYDGEAGAKEKLQHLNFLANTYLANSAVPLTYRVVAMEPYEGGPYLTIDDVRSDEELARRRDRYGADAAVYFTGSSGCSGFATAFNSGQKTADGTEPQYVNADTDAFAVVNQGTICREDTYAHEMGHIVGAGHDFASGGTLEWKPYAHGWSCGDAGAGRKYSSIMSYGQNRGDVGGDFFSSMHVQRDGETCGSDGLTEALQADNVRAMKQAIPYVAAYRSPGGGSDGGAGAGGALSPHLVLLLAVLSVARVGRRTAGRRPIRPASSRSHR